MRGDPKRRRVLALLASVSIVLWLAAGATAHHHDSSAAPCHICQLGHMPALASAAPALVSTPGAAVHVDFLSIQAAPLKPCALHRAPRAPPAA